LAFDIIAFDADDTLWHTEHLYREARDKFVALLSRYAESELLGSELDRTEIKNLDIFGYGVKSFALSMVETAITLTGGKVRAAEIGEIVGLARDMLTSEVRLIDHVRPTLDVLVAEHELMVITKGDASEQIPKLRRSGIAGYFRHVEVVGEKTEQTYAGLLRKVGLAPEQFLMVGNSLKSDIIPVLALGGFGIYIPSKILWSHESVEHPPTGNTRYFELEHLGQLPALVRKLRRSDG